MGARAQNVGWSTHDWTVSPANGPFYAEAWADVKMPGGMPQTATAPDTRRTYVVGSIQVQYTGAGAMFSNAAASANGLPPYQGAVRQVAMLQVNNTTAAGSGSQNWQRYFYGVPRLPNGATRDTNARAVSVWEDPTATSARVAICGETYDDTLVGSQSQNGWGGSNANGSSGFIAVYRGDGELLWTYHFFTDKAGNPNQFESCVITDLSIRVDAEGNEIVTYCGIYNGGDPLAGSALTPVLPFAAPAAGLAGGATTHALGDWDGFVGRLKRTPQGAVSRVFHSIVGGLGQDGLFGLAEIDANRFVAVGAASLGAGQVNDFPIVGLSNGTHAVGTVMLFDASAATTTGNGGPGNLILMGSHSLGDDAGEAATFARDVAIGRRVYFDSYLQNVLCDAIYVVGSTNDATFSADGPVAWPVPPSYGPAGGQPAFNAGMASGLSDGFLTVLALTPTGGSAPVTYSYWGDAGNDGLVGVSCWSEFPDQVAVVGFTDAAGTTDIGVSTFFCNSAFGANVGTGGVPAYANNTNQLHEVRRGIFGSDGLDAPAVPGTTNATATFQTSPNLPNPNLLGTANGGGIAIGNDGRINAVGRAFAWQAQYVPVGGRNPDPSLLVNGTDALRIELDMLPWANAAPYAVGRTDDTGAAIAGYPRFKGSTTPICALAPYGIRIGQPAPELGRMWIDYQGTPPAANVVDVTVMVSRPTTQPGSLALTILQAAFLPATPWATITGCDLWLGDPNQSNYIFADIGFTDRPLRMPLGALPAIPGALLATQAVCLLVNPVGTGPGCSVSSTWTASPALWFTF